MVDLGPALAFYKDRCLWLGYIDNSFVDSLDPRATERARLAIDDELRPRKLRVHKITEVSTREGFLRSRVC